MGASQAVPIYARRRPEETTLYKVVQDNLATLYGAVDDGALPIRLPGFVRKELEGYLDCGLLCRGFARVECGACSEKRLVAFGCGGRGFCPSCLGRKMSETALNLAECVLPPVPLRQWVLTFPYAWRSRLGFDASLFSALTRVFVQTVLAFYTQTLKKVGIAQGQSGAVVALQRTSSDLRLNPHRHVKMMRALCEKAGQEFERRTAADLRTYEGNQLWAYYFLTDRGPHFMLDLDTKALMFPTLPDADREAPVDPSTLIAAIDC